MNIWALCYIFCCLMKVYCIIYVSCVTMMVFCVCINDSLHLLYISNIFLLVAKLLVMSFDSSYGFLFYYLHYYGGCQYVKGTKQILIAVCC